MGHHRKPSEYSKARTCNRHRHRRPPPHVIHSGKESTGDCQIDNSSNREWKIWVVLQLSDRALAQLKSARPFHQQFLHLARPHVGASASYPLRQQVVALARVHQLHIDPSSRFLFLHSRQTRREFAAADANDDDVALSCELWARRRRALFRDNGSPSSEHRAAPRAGGCRAEG